MSGSQWPLWRAVKVLAWGLAGIFAARWPLANQRHGRWAHNLRPAPV